MRLQLPRDNILPDSEYKCVNVLMRYLIICAENTRMRVLSERTSSILSNQTRLIDHRIFHFRMGILLKKKKVEGLSAVIVLNERFF